MVWSFWRDTDASADTIAIQAQATTALLDKATSRMGCYTAPEVVKQLEELANIRGLVQKIRYQEDLQTRPVATALATLKTVVERLERVSREGVLQLLANAMDEVRQAAQNLQQRLPGDVSSALNNEATGGFQGNAAIGGDRPVGARVVTESAGNKATDAAQVNAPMYGDPASLAQFMTAALKAGAK